MRVEDLSDEELAGRAQAGSSSHFEELVRRYQVPLMRFLLRRAGQAEAEDIAQETFLRAYQHLGDYNSRWAFRTWIFTIAHRLAISQGRKMRPTHGEAVLAGVADSVRDPGQIASDREEGQRLWLIARRELTEEQVSALWLHYVEEMPARQIAQVLGRSWVSVKTMLHRARRRLLPHVSEPARQEDGWVAQTVEAGES